ncbi:MAG: peptide chain release factor N(5)-glutamine methyltransferase [Candidatus Accumulibacter sp. UW26]|jgi:release factor glutamine methyltransferase
MIGIGEAWRAASRQLDRLDARLLVEQVAGCTHADLLAHPLRPLAADRWACLEALIRRRAAGEPLAYLLRSAGFYGREFLVTPAVLIPRPETELLVELALPILQGLPAPQLVDLGTGSGVLAVTLKCLLPRATVTAVDLSPAALEVARANACRHLAAVSLLGGDWYAPLAGQRFDLIVANPPYVVAGDPHLLRDGLPFEPPMALTDGVVDGDGLACIRVIVSGAAAHLLPGGGLLIEHGHEQAATVRALLSAEGFCGVASWSDLAGIERVSGGFAALTMNAARR